MVEMQDQGLKGGQLLDTLHQRCVNGNPIVKNMFSRILFVCHKVFFHQINAWLVHGQLVDICDEFFIHKVESNATGGQVDDGKSTLNMTQMTGISSAATNMKNVSNLMSMNPEMGDGESSGDDWTSLYTLRLSMLPTSYIPATLG
jgi:hypothetical protein